MDTAPEITREETITTAAVEERAKLRKTLRRFDTAFMMLAALVSLDTLGAVSSYGGQAFTWLAFIGLFFLLPYALLVAELGSAFPQEGGPYEWVKLAFGRLAGAVAMLMWWVSNPVYLGGVASILVLTVFGSFFVPLTGFFHYLCAIVFIWLTVGAAIIGLHVGKWVSASGAGVRSALLVFFVISVGVYAAKHGVHGVASHAFSPSYAIFIVAAPLLVFNYFGFETPTAAGEEMQDPQRDVPRAVSIAGVCTFLLYSVPVLAILLVLPTSQITGLTGFVEAMKTVFTVYGGHVARDGTPVLTGAGRILGDIGALGFIWTSLSYNATWIMAADRSLAVSAYDGAGPRWLGRFTQRQGTPISANLLSGSVATLMLVLASVITSGNAAKYFQVVLSLAISTGVFAYLLIFPTVIKLRRSRPWVRRPYRIPGGSFGVWAVGVLTTGWVALSVAVVVWPGLGTANPDGSLPSGFANQRFQYELIQILPLVVLVLIGVLFYHLGRRTREQTVTDSVRVSPDARVGEGLV